MYSDWSWLEWTLNWQAQVLRLVLAELGQVDVQGTQGGGSNLLIQLLRQHVHTHWVLSSVAPQLNLGQHLVSKGSGHHKAWVPHGTAKVDKTSLGQEDEVLAILQCVPVHLGLDVGFQLAVI